MYIYTLCNSNKRLCLQSLLYFSLLLCQMQRNGCLSSNGGEKKWQVEPLRKKRARKYDHPQDRCQLSYSHFPSQFDMGNQIKVFQRTQGAICSLVSIFLTYLQFTHRTLKTSVYCVETKTSIKSVRNNTSKNNEQLEWSLVHSGSYQVGGCESPIGNCVLKKSTEDLGCLSPCPAQRELQ